MRTDTAERVLATCRRILENVEAGVFYEPETIEWARRMVRGNADPFDSLPFEPRAIDGGAAASAVTEDMVIRFLMWPLPKDFGPDCGISFDGRKDDQWNKNKTWPVGTNLFTADQARAMLKYVIEGGS
jgi:hypothetical protein